VPTLVEKYRTQESTTRINKSEDISMIARLPKFMMVTVALVILLAQGALPADAQVVATPTQTLDRVAVYGASRFIEMQFADPARPADFVDDGITGTSFFACKLTAVAGLYCLDGKNLRRWSNPKHPTQGPPLLSCNDPTLKLDTKKPNPCTSMSVNLSNAIWLAGRHRLGQDRLVARRWRDPAIDGAAADSAYR
jgi:hypothetical protein